jgi:S1/P1 Nuclease
MCRIAVLLVCLFWLLDPIKASAWDFQGHRVVGSIADQMLTDNARTQVQQILNEGAPPDPRKDLTLRLSGPWADCVRSVRNNNGNFEYYVDPDHLEYEVPCIPFRSKAERERMEEYAKRNWTNCQNPPSSGCHTDYHFESPSSAIVTIAAIREPMTTIWWRRSTPPSRCSRASPRQRRSRSGTRRKRS